MRVDIWPDHRVDRLRYLAAQGYTAELISQDIGITRNAVIGKCGREGIRLVGNKARGSKWGKHPTTIAREQAARSRREGKRPEPCVLVVDYAGGGVPFEGLPPHGCRYALNDAPRHDIGALRFCGEGQAQGSAFCSTHHSVCWHMPPQRPHRRAA